MELVQSVARRGYHIIRKTVPTIAPYIDRILEKQVKVFEKTQANAVQLAQVNGSKRIPEDKWVQATLSCFHEKGDANLLVPEDTANFVQSWVPFLKSKTTVFLYNFFEKNYSLRDPIYYRFLFLKNGKVVKTFSRILGASSVTWFDTDEELFGDTKGLEDGALLIQAYHPRIKVRNNQIRYFVLYKDSKQGITCGVHAMTFPAAGVVSNGPIGYRNVGAKNTLEMRSFAGDVKLKSQNVLNGGDALEAFTSINKIPGVGFYFQMDKQDMPISTWHDGPVPHFANQMESKKTVAPCRTACIVPHFETYAPLLVFEESQLGFVPKKIKVQAFNANNELLAEATKTDFLLPYSFDTQKEFKDKAISGSVYLVMEFDTDLGWFKSPPASMVQVYFRGRDGWSDQTHTHFSSGYSNTMPKINFGHRCLKYAPLVVKPELEWFYSVINVGGSSSNPDQDLFVRVLSDTGEETRFKVTVPSGTVKILESGWLLEQVGNKVNRAALVQLEHPTTNFNGSWLVVNKAKGTVGTDHFTGG